MGHLAQIDGFVLLLMTGCLIAGLALGFAIAWQWGYEAGQDSVTGQDQTIYSTEEK